jgi:hypothetical protein
MRGSAARTAVGGALVLLVVATVVLGVAVPAGAAEAAVPSRKLTLTLVDTSRPTDDPANPAGDAPARTLRTDVYVPSGKGPFPVVLMAHGIDGSPGKFTQLLGAWAGAGYVVVAPAFPLTSNRSPKPTAFTDYVNQPGDLSFVLTQVLARAKQKSSPLYRRVDPKHVGHVHPHPDRSARAVFRLGSGVRGGPAPKVSDDIARRLALGALREHPEPPRRRGDRCDDGVLERIPARSARRGPGDLSRRNRAGSERSRRGAPLKTA